MSAQNTSLDRLQSLLAVAIVRVLQLILLVVISVAVVELCMLIYDAIARNFFAASAAEGGPISSVPDLQRAVQRAFAAILLVILGLELLETLRTYFTEHRMRLQIIIVVALIAVGRHVIQLDFEHLSGGVLAGIGVLIIALAGSYYLMSAALKVAPRALDARRDDQTIA